MTLQLPSETIVVLENSLDPLGLSYVYERPERIVTAENPDELAPAFEAVEAGLDEGLFAAGWIAYEAGYVLEPGLKKIADARAGQRLAWFGLFSSRKVVARGGLDSFMARHESGAPFKIDVAAPGIGRSDYFEAVDQIKNYLSSGDVYQVNFTFPLDVRIDGSLFAAHAALRLAQPVEYSALIVAPDHCVASYSPELFMAKRGPALTVKPMKGTAPRGRWLAEDQSIADDLANDEKSRAENLMIVDLLRNDLSKVALPGSVAVTRLYDVETYRTVQQMTSTVEARVSGEHSLFELFASLFPCGSVTGAPKIRAMEIIDELEAAPRGIYTGAIGHITPQRDFCFSVPIRTLTLDREGRGLLGTGSGIVADSTAQAEFDESLLKAAFLRDPQPSPELIETMLWRPDDGIWLLDMHLDRLADSAAYFRHACSQDELRSDLDAFTRDLNKEQPWRIRLLLSSSGATSFTASPVAEEPNSGKIETVAISNVRVNSMDPYLFHKTTRRQVYDEAYASQAVPQGHLDIVFLNERGEITEGSRTNIFAAFGTKMYTPPLSCGLLPGTLRRSLLEDSRKHVVERILSREDLLSADRIFVGNSIHGLTEVEIAEQLV